MSDAKIIISAEDRTKAVMAGLVANLGQVQAKGEGLNASFGKIGALLGSAFAGFTLTEFIKSTVNGLDALKDIKDATGASIENISALEDVALRTGTSLETVTTSLVRLNQALIAADAGSPQAAAFEAIGLSVKELRSLDPAEVLHRVAIALAGYADDGNKARLVQELFSRSIREVGPLLADLAEQGRLNATVTTAQADAAKKFANQIHSLEKNSIDLARTLVSGLIPVVQNLLTEMKLGVEIFGSFGAALLNIGTSNPGKNLGDRAAEIEEFKKKLGELQAAADDPDRGFFFNAARNKRDQDSIKASIAAAEKLLAYYKAVQLTTLPKADYSNEGHPQGLDGKPSLGSPKPPKSPAPSAEKIDESRTALAAYVRELQGVIDKNAELTPQQEALNQLRALGALGEVPQVRALVLALADKVDLQKRELDTDKLIGDELERQWRLQNSLDAAIEQFAGRTADALKQAQTARLEQRLAAGEAFSPEELEKIVKGIAGIKDEAAKDLGELDELTKQFARNIQDALGNTIEDALRGNFSSIGQLWTDLLIKMAAQAMAAKIGQDLFGDLFKSGPGGGELGGLFGGLFKSLGIFGFAGGGDFGGGLRIVGERGPELQATGPSRIWNADQTRAMLGSPKAAPALAINYSPTISIDSRADRAAAMAETRLAVAQGQRDLLAMLHAKGVY